MTDSRLTGFYQLSLAERIARLKASFDSSPLPDDLEQVLQSGGLTPDLADKVVENVLGVYALPLGLALNFQVNGQDRLVPMVVEEPSVIAAASNAAKLVRQGGGFRARMLGNLTAAQIELRELPDFDRAALQLSEQKAEYLELARQALPKLVARGGGPVDLKLRSLFPGHAVLHLEVDTCDAMGANLVNTLAETLGPLLAERLGAQLGLRILSNLSDGRLVEVEASVPFSALLRKNRPELSGREVALGVEAASVFAERDPYRAATHNKGIMNGLDSVVLATGNDYRAVEAGAHAFAARNGRYEPLGTWRVEGEFLVGRLLMPLSLGIVGGTLRVHPTARLALQLAEAKTAAELSMLAGCAGLASNLAALLALSTTGIQAGHMALHARSVAVLAGASGKEVELLAAALVAAKSINESAARELLAQLRSTGPAPV